MSLTQGIADATAKFGWPAMDLLLQSAFLKLDALEAWPELSPPVAIEEARAAFRRWAKSLIRLTEG